jgi:hypothetical protein
MLRFGLNLMKRLTTLWLPIMTGQSPIWIALSVDGRDNYFDKQRY